MAELPTGTVTFLFTDIEASTRLLSVLGSGGYAEVLSKHQRIMREVFAAHHGREVDTQGDSFFVAFRRAKDAVAAAVDAQRVLAAESWPEGTQVLVRMGLHTGEPEVGEERYVGLGVHKAARIGAAGHGGQVLLSRTTSELVEDDLPPGVSIRVLGERRLKDLERTERLSQLMIEGLETEFGPLNTLDLELTRKRRRIYAGAALIGVLAAAVAISVFALGRDAGGGSAAAPPNSVAVIDPRSNEVVTTVPVGVRPSAIAVGESAVLVANLDDRSISRIDPVTRTVLENITLQATPTGLAIGAGAVWIANGLLGSVSRLDFGVNAAPATIEDLAPPQSNAGSIAVGESSVWFASGSGTLVRIDPSTNAPSPTEAIGLSPSAIAVGEGFVWIANAGSNTIVRVNPRTNRVVRTFSVGRSPRGVAVGDGAVWVTGEADDTVTRIDAASGSATTITVGSEPTGIAYGAAAVWVANSGDATISRIDPQTNDVVATIEVGNRPIGVAVANGVVWVSVQAPVT